MRQSELNNVFRTAGFPVVFSTGKKKLAMPYVRFMRMSSESVFADDRVLLKTYTWHAILVSADKDVDAEMRLEAAMDAAGLCYEIVDETFVDTESLYQVIYEFTELEE